MIYRKGLENIDWRDDWECTTAVDFERGQEGHNSCISDSGNMWVFLEVVCFLGMRVKNVQLGYIVGKSLNRQRFESFCNFQVKQGRY